MALGDVIARLAVSLNLETAAFDKNARQASTTVGKMQATMSKAAGAIGAAFAGIGIGEAVTAWRDMTKAAIDSAGGLGEAAAQLGVSTDALQQFRFAATQVGVSSEEMDKALGQLTRRLGDAQMGVKEPAKALEQLGITLDSIKGKDTGEVIGRIAEGLAQIPDPTQRAAVAVDLFGRSGQQLLPFLEGGAAGIQAFKDEAERLGVVLSSEEIANADKVADDLAKLNYVIEAQQNKKLLENSEAIIKYEQSIGELKLAMIGYFGAFVEGAARNDEAMARWRGQLKDFLDNIVSTARTAPFHVQRMVNDIIAAITGRLNAAWDSAKRKVAEVKAAFFDLWDKVTRRSYVPDMVDDIAREMARLDGVMVNPAKAATDKVKASMREMAQETSALLDRLFPEVRRLLDYRADMAALDRLPSGQREEASYRLNREFAGVRGDVPVSVADYDEPLVDAKKMEEAALRVGDALAGLKTRSKLATVQVAKSFHDMAQQTIGALQSLTNAVRGGGFLDILSSVVGLGLQLGGIGLFGKKIAGRINAPSTVPRYANGTNFHPGGLAVVGERRAELVELPRGARVHPNLDKLGGETVIRLQLTDDLDARIIQGAGRVVVESFPALVARSKAETMRSLNRPSLA